MKKLALLVVIVLLVASTFVGCAARTTAPATSAAPTASAAPKFPTKTITVIVPNATGGGSDLTARAVAQFAQKYLGVSMVIENKDGGGQTVGHTYFKSTPNDGYTMVIWGNSGTTVAPLLQTTQYDPFVDELPIGRVTNLRNALVVSKSAPYQTLDAFVKYCQANPGVKWATSGANGIDDLTARLFNLKYKTGIIPVAYGSGSEATLAVLSGECQAACTSVTAAQAQVDQGKVTVLAIACSDRDPNHPEYKTTVELGYDVAMNNSIGYACRKGTDPAIKAILEKFIADVTKDPDFIKLYTGMNMSLDYLNAADAYKISKGDYDNAKAAIAGGA